MAEVSYALREDPSSIYLLEDAGKYYGNYCQVTVLARILVRPEFFRQFLFFAPYTGNNGKYNGTVTKVQLSLEANEQGPAYDYVTMIESEVEFKITPSVMRQLSRDHMPAWGMKSYLDYFSDRKSGVLLFLRVYKVNQAVNSSYLEKGSKGSSQILKIYDPDENEVSLRIDGMTPVISDNKFSYIKDEIIHLLKVENAFIAEYDSTDCGLQSLRERIEADRLIHGTHQRWEYRHLQWVKEGYNVDGNSDMAQLDYEAIYQEVLEICPGMKPVIDYVRNIQAARQGEYYYLLKNVHEHNENERTSSLRIFDISVRAAVKNALYYHKKLRVDLEDSFQVACIGIITAIQKHSDSVKGLFPSYASMWMIQIMSREMPIHQYNFRLPVHYREYIDQVLRQQDEQIGELDFVNMDFEELYHLLLENSECDEEMAAQMASVLIPAESIEEMINDPKREMCLVDDSDCINEIMRVIDLEPVRESLEILSEREKSIIIHRYGFDGFPEASLEEVGNMYGITRERVRQIELKAESKILSHLRRIRYLTKEQINILSGTRYEIIQKKKRKSKENSS